jgi:transcription elongation factor SPT5
MRKKKRKRNFSVSRMKWSIQSSIYRFFYTGDLFNDDEISSDGLGDVSHVGYASSTVQDLEDEARRIVARGARPDTITGDLALPFRVPRDTDPSVWSVRVKVGVLLSAHTVLTNHGQLGKEADVVLQICRRCLEPSESQPPAITSAFARTSIPGYIFIEAYHVGEVRHAVDGFFAVRDMKPNFIAPTEYVGLLSRTSLSSSRVEVGQWVCCLVGRYRNDLGYVLDAGEWNAIVVFVPRIPKPRGKRQRDGRPAPRTWTAAEVIEQYGHERVQVRKPNGFIFAGSVYENGLVMERVPISHLRVSSHSPGDIAPFVRSTILQTEPLFDSCVKRFAQDSIQVGDRILVVSEEHAGIIGRIERIHDHVADIVTQSPEEHSGLVISIVLRDLIPHFLAGDHVKDRWSNRVGIVVAVDNNDKKLTFMSKETNEEVSPSHYLPPSLTISKPVDHYIDL